MAVQGLPTAGNNPEFSADTFSIYCPKLKEWVKDPNNASAFTKFVDICNSKILYSYYLEDWEYAFSLAVAHYICITDTNYVQAIGADTAVGGVMSSRSVGGINYSYDLDKTMNDNPAYKFWQRTGYGNQLVALTNAKGWLGILVVN